MSGWLAGTIKYLGLAILILVIVSALNFWQITRPPKIIQDNKPADFGLPNPESIILTASDGAAISAWYLAAEEPVGAILFLHGYPAEKSDMLFLASALWPDYSLLLKDFRYFGQSEGRAATLGIKEPGDIISAVNWLAGRGYANIGLFGFSYGGAQALLAAEREPQIKAVASVSAYADLRRLGRDILPLGQVLGWPIVAGMETLAYLTWGQSPASRSPAQAAANLDIPLWIAHDRQDNEIPFHHAEQLVQAASRNPKLETYFFDLGRHGGLPLPEFTDELKDFFDRAW